MAFIPVSYMNSAGVLVDQRFIVRASGNRPTSAGSYEVYNPETAVISLEIGGIPNGISAVGFTSQLRAYALPATANPGVMWRSDDSSVVAVTPVGRVYSVGSGVALLRATSTGYDSSGKQISKSVFVKVGKDQAKSNIPPELAKMLNVLNTSVWGPEGVQFYLLSGRKDFSYPEAFCQKYGNYPSVVDTLPVNSAVSSSNSLALTSGKTALKPSVKFFAPVDTIPEIGIVPFVLSVSLSAEEISGVIGNSSFSIEKFFERAVFCSGISAENVFIDNGAKGINAREAENRGILSVKEDPENITFILNGWFAAIGTTSSVVDGQLILSDGKSNGFIDSEIWLATFSDNRIESEKPASEGCNFWFGGGVVWLILVLLLIKRTKAILSFFIFTCLILLNVNMAFGGSFTVDLNYSILRIVRNQPVSNITAAPQPVGEGYMYSWSTTNPNVVELTSATASTAGISGVSKGKAVVVCEVTSDDGITKAFASCDVTVFESGMSGVIIEPSLMSLYLGFNERGHLIPGFQPVGAEPINYTWATDNLSVVSVDNNGYLLAKNKGVAKITYTAIAIPIGGGDPRSFDAICLVTVLRPVLSIDIDQNPSPVIIGGRGSVSASFFPSDADSVDIAWSSIPHDASVVSIEPTSLTSATFNAIGFPAPNRTPGKNPVTVTASSVHWKKLSLVQDVSCEIVIDPIQISSVSVIPSDPRVISPDDRVQFSHTVAPANATKSNDFWNTSNRLVADVSTSGLVTGLNQGEASISYTFCGWLINADGTHSPAFKIASSIVIVTSPPSSIRVSDIEIEPIKLNLPKGASFQVRAWVSPYNSTNKAIYWYSDNLLVASVNANGLVTAFNPGTTYIYADPADRGVDGQVAPVTCEVTVYDGAVIDDPSFVNIPGVLQNKIEQMNAPLKRVGLEVNFGFALNKSKEEALVSYGSSPIIIPILDESSKLKISIAKPISIDSFEPVTGSAEFEVDVSSYKFLGHTPILPVSIKILAAKDILEKCLPQYSIEELLKNPRQYSNQLFSTLFFHKQIVDVVSRDLFVPLFNNSAVALEAERLGIITVKGVGDQLEFTLNYYVADSSNTDANILDGNLIIGDGAANGIIHDPVWIFVRKTKGESESNEHEKSEKSSGCNSTAGPNVVRFIAIMMLCYVLYRRLIKK
jgi:uncharacterized protein YjdB